MVPKLSPQTHKMGGWSYGKDKFFAITQQNGNPAVGAIFSFKREDRANIKHKNKVLNIYNASM